MFDMVDLDIAVCVLAAINLIEVNPHTSQVLPCSSIARRLIVRLGVLPGAYESDPRA